MKYVSIAIVLAAGMGEAAFGQAGRAIEKGSAEAYELEVRARQQAEESASARRFEVEAAAFAKVKDAKSFYEAVAENRRSKVKALYEEREKIRTDRGPRKRIAEINKEIVAINDPKKAYIPDVSSAKVITLDQEDGVRWIRVIQVVDSRNAIMKSIEAYVGRQDIEFWLTGVDTTDWVDGKNVKLNGLLVSAGTESFETAAGTLRTMRWTPKTGQPDKV